MLYFSDTPMFRPVVFQSPSPLPKNSLFSEINLKKSKKQGRKIPDYRKMDTEKRPENESLQMVSLME